ncbi:MAG: GNVR domain-containing protein [Pseudomonadota bacterium]
MSPESENLRQNLASYLEFAIALKKRTKLILWVALAGSVLTVLGATLMSPVYTSSTLILIQPQRLPSSYVQSAISVDLNDRLRTLTPQIMSRSRLEQIINKFDLYGPTQDPKQMESKVDRMRKSIKVQVKGEDTFRIYFSHRSPRVARETTQELAHLFIEDNLRDRANQAESTSEFLDSELNNLKGQLESQEEALRRFKEGHLGVLPEQQSANLRALDRFQNAYQTNTEALQAARDRKTAIEEQISKANEEGTAMVLSDSQLDSLKAQLGEKRAQLTDKHPDVRFLERKVHEMEEKLAALKQRGDPRAVANTDPYTRSVLGKLERANHDVAQLEVTQERLEKDIADYQRRIERLPSVETQLILLTRDYDTTRTNYQALLNKKFEARLSINLEKKQKDAAFKVLDPAYLPASPDSPSRGLVVLMGILISGVLGLAVAFAAEALDTTIRSERDLRDFGPAPVIAMIPRLRKSRDETAEPKQAAG